MYVVRVGGVVILCCPVNPSHAHWGWGSGGVDGLCQKGKNGCSFWSKVRSLALRVKTRIAPFSAYQSPAYKSTPTCASNTLWGLRSFVVYTIFYDREPSEPNALIETIICGRNVNRVPTAASRPERRKTRLWAWMRPPQSGQNRTSPGLYTE